MIRWWLTPVEFVPEGEEGRAISSCATLVELSFATSSVYDTERRSPFLSLATTATEKHVPWAT